MPQTREYMREWRRNNPEKVRASRKRYLPSRRIHDRLKHAAHPEQVRAAEKASRDRNRPRVRKNARDRWENNEGMHAYQQDYRRKNNIIAAFFIRGAKLEGCVDCGELDPVVLDLDHIGADKSFGLSRVKGKTYGLATVLNEIAKCEVRCSNCHRRMTAKRRLSAAA